MLCTLLRQAGHTPIPAYDAMQTLMFALRAPVPDLVVLDINMPGGSGIDALQKLKQSAKTCSIPVVVVSGNADPAMPAAVRALGADEVLTKPIDGDAFLASVKRALAPPRH